MHLLLVDDKNDILVEYDEKAVIQLLIKYFEVHKDIEKAFSLLSQDLLEKARNK
jgi:hypothetical protein